MIVIRTIEPVPADANSLSIRFTAVGDRFPDRQREDLDMGLIRKTMSVGTLGAVDFRSDKERTAAYTKDMRKEARKQTKIMQNHTQQSGGGGWQPNPLAGWSPPSAATTPGAAAVPPPPASSQTSPPPPPPAAWYPDANQPGVQRYWDGVAWTEHTAPL